MAASPPTRTYEIPLPIRLRKDGDWYIASCPLLDLHAQGKNKAEAQKNLFEALSLFLDACKEMGTLEEVLVKEAKIPCTGSIQSARIVRGVMEIVCGG